MSVKKNEISANFLGLISLKVFDTDIKNYDTD